MKTPILLLNCGSSSIKYQMIDATTEQVCAVGLVQKIGDAGTGTIEHETQGEKFSGEQHFADHEEAIAAVVAMFSEHGPDLSQAIAVGHRIVHGGETFHRPTLIDDVVIDKIKDVSGLAPLHNPPAISGIRAARHILPDVPHVAIFDTAFFSDLPEAARTYAIDTDLARAHHIRKYGFHGTSHAYVSQKAAEVLGRDVADLRTITCHLGNGASISAVQGGRPIDTSMGLTPLQGLVMGTRSGDIDPGIHAYLAREMGMGLDDVDTLLNKRSGMFGLTGYTDMRDIEARMNEGDERAKLGMAVYVHRLVGYIGSYIAHLGGVDALVFTAGVGENASIVRRLVCEKLAPLGFVLDEQANSVRSREPRVISTPDSPVTVLVVPTNEELAMARQTLATIS
ncbi:MAG TPA: acetate kinase [Propionibacteriaceae bacterium]|nr:acetate kinase [Propionibacteriaceae bacterium]